MPAEHREQIEKLAQRLASGFAEYREQETLPDLEALTAHQRTVHAGELASVLGWLATQHGELVSDTFKAFVTVGQGYAGSVLDAAIRAIEVARDRANEFVRPMRCGSPVGHVGGATDRGGHRGPVVLPAVDGARCAVSERAIATRVRHGFALWSATGYVAG
ncbi:MAG: hypothetical protein CM15mP74_09330 [Halieaceae bacterium]|nr:MAG: hypothetical protein CM15mP74_09330 [Halieaceae bacterium]